MSLYVDKLTKRPVPRNRNYHAGKWAFFWCHLWADTEQELRDYVLKIGMDGARFQKPYQFCQHVHLQILTKTRDIAVSNGAIDTVQRCVVKQPTKATTMTSNRARKLFRGKVIAEQFDLFPK